MYIITTMLISTRSIGRSVGILPLGEGNGIGLVGTKVKDVKGQDLKKDLGIAVRANKATKTIDAFVDPVKANKDYQAALDLVMDRAAALYIEVGTKAEAAGFAQDQAVTYARDRAKDFVEAEMALLQLEHPFAESAESLIQLASGAKRRDVMGKVLKK